MDRSSIAYLVSKEWVQDEYGVQHELTSEREIYVQVDSVTYSEFFEGGRNGLNPELRFTAFRFDYMDEDEIRYNGKYYRIYRTYFGRDDTIELYAERRKGNADDKAG